MFDDDKYNVKYAELLLTILTGEMNRLRDWPIRILGFTSAFHFAVIAGILVSKINFIYQVKCFLSFFFTLLFFWTAYCFWKCHINYIITRNAQIDLENKIGMGDMDVIPKDWIVSRFQVLQQFGGGAFMLLLLLASGSQPLELFG